MAVIWTSVQKELETNGIKMFVYGKAGVGKTMLAATLPRTLIVSRESGLLSLSKQNIERVFAGVEHYTDQPVAKIETQEDCTELLNICRTPQFKQNFDTVYVDSLSEIAENILEHTKKDPKCKDARQAYMKTQEFIVQWVRDMRDLVGVNVVMVCKMDTVKDEISGVTRQAPMMPGQQTGKALPYLFDVVLFYGVDSRDQKNVKRFVQTQPDLQNEAKDRSGKLDMIEYPHLGYLFNKIKGNQ